MGKRLSHCYEITFYKYCKISLALSRADNLFMCVMSKKKA